MVKRSFGREDYFKALDLARDPFQNYYSESSFFITPELQHRLDLIRHLLEFSQQILLVKGVSKVGKTTFCQHLLATAGADWIICQINASAGIGPDTLIKAMLQEHMGTIEDTAETIAGLNRYLEFCNLNTRVPILFIDDVDNLNQASLRFIFQLMEFREKDTFIRVVLVGQDSFLQRLNEVAEELANNNLVHAVTIPAFTSEQTTAYLRHRLRACGGREDMFTEKEESRIHKVAAGVAGDINFLARQGLSDPAELVADKSAPKIAEEKHRTPRLFTEIMFVSVALTFSIIALWMYLQKESPSDTKTVLINLPPEPLSSTTNVANEMAQYSSGPLPDAWLESPAPSSVSAQTLVEVRVEDQARKQNIIEDGAKNPVDQVVQAASNPSAPGAQVLPEAVGKIGPGYGKIKGANWLLAQPSDHYVLQLMGALERGTITRFLQDARLDRKKMALFKTKQSGKDWYVLVYGLYSGREQARAAIASLSELAQAEKPWPKTVASIHEAIKSP